jgi:segregation and condensation protein B
MPPDDSDDNVERDDAEPTENSEDETVAYGETDDWNGNDLEAAYRRALEANDAVEWEFDHLAPADETSADDAADQVETGENGTGTEQGVDDGAKPHSATDASGSVPESVPQRVTARQVIEAAIFVGGESLTTKKLCYMLKGDYDLDAVDRSIEELNLQYVDEARPYEIRLGEGGYRMVLREEHERIRNRVFGIGPREVKLSQDVLEVLALVAYRQPVTPEEIEELGKEKPGPFLRQLLRRELISLERDAKNRKRVTYSTTKRFLSLFGLGSIDELPQADELAFK